MPWTEEKREWIDSDDAVVRNHAPFQERGVEFLKAWAKHHILGGELRLGIGYACDPKTEKRLGAIISVIFDGGPPIDFTAPELGRMADFLQAMHDAGTFEDTPEDNDDLAGLIQILKNGIKESEKFEPENLN